MIEDNKAQRAPRAPRVIEVELLRKYVPDGQETEVKVAQPAGTVLSLPSEEAQRALKFGIAQITAKTFE